MSLTLVTFNVGPRRCGLPIGDVEEVLRIVAVRPCPAAPSFVEGVINRRGTVTPVIDLRKRFSVACGPFDSETHIVITTLRGQPAALIVDEVSDVIADGDEPVVMIDPAKILTDDEGRAFDAADLS